MKNYLNFFKNKTVLITGGTGSLGQALTKYLLKTDLKSIRILSRNENKQITMQSEINDERIRFLIGDVRDLSRLERAVENVDIVFHAAALKHVPVIEYNPFEAIKTNVIGSQNIIDACLNENVDRAICVGTDKAVSPLNTYGATKLLMEKLFVSANASSKSKRHKTKFIALRYGNVLGSSGSVIPKFISQIKNKQKITMTNPNMTRFSLTMNEALSFILESSVYGNGSEIFVPKLKAYSLLELKQTLTELLGDTGEKIINERPGEKLHETLINSDEAQYTWSLENKYVIFNPLKSEKEIKTQYSKIKKAKILSAYSSNTVHTLSKNEMKKIIKNSGLLTS